MNNKHLRALVESALLVAAAYVLGYFKADFWTEGGSISFVMVPLVIIALRHGLPWGIGAGAVFGTLKCFFAGGFAWGWASILLDYSVAYAAVGLSAVFRKKSAVLSTVFGGLMRFAVHFISGITIYAVSTASPGEFFHANYTNAWVFSLLYNGSYMLGSIVLTAVVIFLLGRKDTAKYLKPQ